MKQPTETEAFALVLDVLRLDLDLVLSPKLGPRLRA